VISVTDEQFDVIDNKYFDTFGEHIPLMMIPESETIEGLAQKVNDSIKAGRNLLPELYDWRDDVLY